MQASSNSVGTSHVAAQQNATATWRANKAARDELGNQLETLEDRRRSLVGQLEETPAGTAKSGLETRIADIDKRIAEVDKQISTADVEVAKSAAVPGAVVIPPPPPREIRQGPPEEAFVLGGIFIFVVLLPLSIAMARRIWKRSSAAVMAFPQELADRLNRLDQAVDSIAVEVERIGEGQRFVTRLMSEPGRALGTGAAQPIDVAARDRAAINREGR